MKKIIIHNLIDNFNAEGRGQLAAVQDEVKRNGVCRLAFAHISNSAFEALKRQEYNLNRILLQCETDIEVIEVCSKILDGIKGINEKTIIDFALYYCNLHDIPIDDSCETLLTNKGRKALKENRLTVKEIRQAIEDMAIRPFTNCEITFFINNVISNNQKN